jgi:hypothetical protein
VTSAKAGTEKAVNAAKDVVIKICLDMAQVLRMKSWR